MKKLTFNSLFIPFCIYLCVFDLSSQDLGGVGYIDLPSAYMLNDGDIKFTNTHDAYYEGVGISYQVTPYLQGIIRYHKAWHWDRSIEIKARLLKESELLPEISLGIRDIGGTAIYGGEYIVASKNFNNTEFSIGLGWGRLSGGSQINNPLRLISESFGSRDSFQGRGGTLRYLDYFSGPNAGIFGAIKYKFTNYPLELITEYSSDNFQTDVGIDPRFRNYQPPPINFGVRWLRNDNTSFTLSRQLGDWAINADFTTSTIDTPRAYRSNLSLLEPMLSTNLNSNLYFLLNYEAYRRGINIIDGEIDPNTGFITLVVSTIHINYIEDVINEVFEILRLNLDPQIADTARIIVLENGYQIYEIESDIQSSRIVSISELSNPYFSSEWNNRGLSKLELDWSIGYKQMLFDPDNPLRLRFTFGPTFRIRTFDEWLLLGRYEVAIHDEFDDYWRPPDSNLPHVRTELKNYFQQGKKGFDYLYLNKRGNIGSTWNYNLFLGYLEWMYAGIGFELLNYNPFKNYAYGFHYANLRQRAYDRGFGFNDLRAETFFISGYYDLPYYDLDLAVHVGQYLARDRGVTFDLRRSFASGWEVGAFATFTNVSFEDFGEGSFDKGIYLSIPWSNYISQRVNRRATNKIRFIQRDGGQYLDGMVGQLWFNLQHFNPKYLH